MEPLADKWRAFGWDAVEVDGHDVDEVAHQADLLCHQPRVLIARTVKGKGIVDFEGQKHSHGSPVTAELREQALSMLDAKT